MDIFIGSQNIYDREGKIVACELLYRNSLLNKYDESVSSETASCTIIKNIINLGLDIVTGGKIALINCDDKVLRRNIITILPRDKVVIELLETLRPTEEVIKEIKRLNDFGFKLALDDIVDLNGIMDFIPFISCVKVDYKLIEDNNKKVITEFCKQLGIKLLAEKIENEEEYKEALELGFDYFQGYYLSKPKVMQTHDIELKSSSLYKLLGEITKDNMDLDKIENIMKLDAGLMYKFIRFINSASNGFVERVSNIKQSIMLIGEDPFRKWILLFFYSDLSGEDNEEYTNKAAIRGRFCELIMEKIDRSKKNDAFISGLLLDINLLLGKEIDEILDEIHMSNEVDNALRGHSCLIKDVLDIAVNYSEINKKQINNLYKKIGIDKNILYKLYLEAMVWVKNL